MGEEKQIHRMVQITVNLRQKRIIKHGENNALWDSKKRALAGGSKEKTVNEMVQKHSHAGMEKTTAPSGRRA